ncbi:ABC transporter ATP-binding protein [Tsukamurella asaccharolytica]|uniref:ABC transporter ATP-binding protein n=1 Tax=Tsukamurella asaccharolytica TaxID=2592067 RepID=A0A5C5R7F4_9ACTN|nr:ABC transporter ATP-binding protein [Tsukamurella asaccharolytica]TWS18354.1 ABC transporter ATP-binding protein [Tsukamurella asaccharolytica]
MTDTERHGPPASAAADGRESPPPALEVTDLHISFDYPRPAVAGISLTVERGRILALVGESGSGKTMTALAAIGLLPRGATVRGSVRVDGSEVIGRSERELTTLRGRAVAMVFQEPQTALNPVRTIGWQVREALRAHGRLSRAQARDRAVELLALVEIPDPEKRVDYFPHQLSGGQKQRVVIALALANEPALLLADEPTTALDVSVQAEILDLLVRLRDRTGAGILLITHNLGVVADIADDVVVVQLGEVVERGDVHTVFARPEHPYTRQLLESVPRLPLDGVPVPTPSASATEEAPSQADSSAAEAPALVVDRVSVHFPGRFGAAGHRALSDVSLTVGRGEIVGVVGESGSGKTTLGRAVGALVPLTSGTITVAGRDISSLSRTELRATRRLLAFVPQDPAASLNPRFTVGESVREPLDIHRVGDRAERAARVAELLDAVQLPTSFAHRLPHELSGGQRQRVALARALAARPQLLIADEPTSALDVSVQARVLELFVDLQADLGFAALFISHDLAVVRQVSDRVAVLRGGRLEESGETDAVLTNPASEYTRRLVDAVPYPDPVVQRARSSRTSVAG